MSISLKVALASAPFVFWAHAQVYKAPVKVDPVPSATVKVDPVRPYTSPICSFTLDRVDLRLSGQLRR